MTANKATPEELVKRLRKYAAECGNCDGTGKFVSYPDEWPCELCATERETADLIESQRNIEAYLQDALRQLHKAVEDLKDDSAVPVERQCES